MTAADPPHRIFLSYARADGETAAGRLGDLLREQGLGSWQDLREIGSDDTVWPQIEAALAEAQHIVVVVTEGAVTSGYVRREWRQARQSGATVSAVLGTEMSRGDLPRWLRRGEIYRLDHPDRLARLLATLRAPGRQQRAFWDDGKHLRHHVPRQGLFDEIRGQLLSDEGGPVAMTSALHGRGGFGKTTLAAMVAQDAEIRDGFIDGVFWVTLGRETTHVLGTIETLVRRMTGTPQGFTDVNSAAEHLAKLLDHRDALVIVDDVWRRSDLEPFLTATRNASLLVTTRDDTVLPRDVDPFTVDRLTAPEALELLSRGLSPDAAETVQLAAFAETFWHWAQLLAIANDILVQRVARRQNLATALEALTKELRTTGLDAADERGLTLDAGLAISLDMLPEDTRADVERLGVFPEDVAIPLEIVSALWGRTAFTTESAAIDLERKALLAEVDLGEGTVLLHDNILWYLRRRIGDDRLRAAQAAFLDAVRPASGAWADLSADARYLRSHLRHHLIGAGREAE
ncbi:MAG: NB-ARC domain-containing protein, partial [Pseudomonadota bacterium]